MFIPWSPCNVKEVFAAGGNLDDVWQQPFFRDIRAWQRAYGYRENGEPYTGGGNWLAPCLVRDHHGAFAALRRRLCLWLPTHRLAGPGLCTGKTGEKVIE